MTGLDVEDILASLPIRRTPSIRSWRLFRYGTLLFKFQSLPVLLYDFQLLHIFLFLLSSFGLHLLRA